MTTPANRPDIHPPQGPRGLLPFVLIALLSLLLAAGDCLAAKKVIKIKPIRTKAGVAQKASPDGSRDAPPARTAKSGRSTTRSTKATTSSKKKTEASGKSAKAEKGKRGGKQDAKTSEAASKASGKSAKAEKGKKDRSAAAGSGAAAKPSGKTVKNSGAGAEPSSKTAPASRKKTRPTKKDVPPSASGKAAKARRFVVVVDPGHGGSDPGAMSGGLREERVTLELGRALGRELSRLGVKVILTRTSDTDVSLSQRTATAARNRADLLLSLHCNAHKNPGHSGLETYALLPRKYLEQAGGRGKRGRPVILPAEYVPEDDTESMALAGRIHDDLCRRIRPTGMSDGGFKLARFQVLGTRAAPSVLVEVGYLTNKADAKRLRSKKFVDAFSRSLAASVLAALQQAGGPSRMAQTRSGQLL